jgi:uncharacterized protein (DUF58 family)
VSTPGDRLRRLWRKLRSWRRIRFTRAGTFFTIGAFAVGFAAINTGNNLLYLLLGAMLGAMGVSGWLSEQTLTGLRIVRRVARGGHVGAPISIHYEVGNRKRYLATYALELQEPGLPEIAYVAQVGAGETASASMRPVFLNRGVYPLEELTLGTDYPFGLFRKEREVPVPGEIVVWPRIDLRVRTPVGGGGQRPRPDASRSAPGAGARGEFRGLREYRPGDDPRDIHWRSSARTGIPVLREYDLDASEALWLSLDVGTPEGEASEHAADLTASLAARLLREGSPVALHAGTNCVASGTGPAQLERILDAIARVDFGVDDGAPPVPRARCVRITAGDRGTGWADTILARGPSPEPVEGGRGAGAA